MDQQQGENFAEIGMIGLGVMGQNFSFNIAEHGYHVAGLNKKPFKIAQFKEAAGNLPVHGYTDPVPFVKALKKPRAIILLVPAGDPVDSVIQELLPLIDPGDLIVDGGNSFFKDTDRRQKMLSEKGILFMGMGISGGEHGARFGPSLMPGGPREGYDRVKGILEAVAAKVDGVPSVAYMGPGSAGDYVKMTHNGLEYALMELISETYNLMKQGLTMDVLALHEVYAQWNQTELASYLIEITADIFTKIDDQTGKPLVNMILDAARQKGTGKWTSQDAMDLNVPDPAIDMAVSMRDLSDAKEQRVEASQVLDGPPINPPADRVDFLNQLQSAMYAGMIIVFAQGMALLRAASQAYNYHLDLESIATIWRGGCIIRAAMLEKIREAYKRDPELVNLLLDPALCRDVIGRQGDLREVIRYAMSVGIPVPGFMACLGYYDSYRSAWLPANLIQAQRDYFGAHTYQRIDMDGTFHTNWQGG